MSEFDHIRATLATFTQEREWDQFHSPKNLVMALSVEVAELMEHFQWLTEQQSSNLGGDAVEAIAEEIADVQVYLLMLAEKLNIDILQSVNAKIIKNAAKYPSEKAKGKAQKYSAYTRDDIAEDK
jgi:NTP pyrophosphatase (non-canonical NTP hydrolase)